MAERFAIEGVLTRRVPRSPDSEHLDLDSLPAGWFGISHRWIESGTVRRHGRGNWYLIENANSSTSVFRVLRLEPTLKFEPGDGEALPSGEIWIDWDGWIDLANRAKDMPRSMPLRIRRARWWQTARLAEKHPDPTYRLAVRVAWILGLISILMGLVSILLTMLPR